MRRVLEFAEASGLSFLGLLIGLALYLFGLGVLLLLFDGDLYVAKLEDLLPLIHPHSVGLSPLPLGREEEEKQ